MQKKYWIYLVFAVIITACGDNDDPTVPDPDPLPVENPYEDCLVDVGENTLELVTWNIKQFPLVSSTVERVEEIIESYNPDVIALQEISSLDDFDDLVEALEGWEGHVEQVGGSSMRLGYLFKTAEVTVTVSPMNLYEEFNDDYNSAFTSVRRPLYTQIEHTNGLVVDLINVHLKCCSGSEDRRRRASVLIKDYIDQNLSTSNVVFLGDFNDEIVDQDDNVFQNFIDDANNFRFATMPIAEGPQSEWSFNSSSFISQIDQILISNELFNNEAYTTTIKPGECESSYADLVSDHRPVIIRLNAD